MLLIHKIKNILRLQSGSKSVKLVDIDVDITMILSVHEVPHTVLSQRWSKSTVISINLSNSRSAHQDVLLELAVTVEFVWYEGPTGSAQYQFKA